MAYDYDQLAINTKYHEQNTDDALELFNFLRKMTYNVIKNLPMIKIILFLFFIHYDTII